MKKTLWGRDYSDNETVKLLIYLCIGGTAALIEWGCYFGFNILLGINYLVATTLAFSISTLCHYFLGNIFVFNSGARYERGKELTLVFVVSGIGLAFNLLLMALFVGWWGWPGMVAKVVTSCIVVVWNYLSRKKWIF
ncbi:MAG: GtrA family protein [Acidaminococcaceae bacterium]